MEGSGCGLIWGSYCSSVSVVTGLLAGRQESDGWLLEWQQLSSCLLTTHRLRSTQQTRGLVWIFFFLWYFLEVT